MNNKNHQTSRLLCSCAQELVGRFESERSENLGCIAMHPTQHIGKPGRGWSAFRLEGFE